MRIQSCVNSIRKRTVLSDPCSTISGCIPAFKRIVVSLRLRQCSDRSTWGHNLLLYGARTAVRIEVNNECSLDVFAEFRLADRDVIANQNAQHLLTCDLSTVVNISADLQLARNHVVHAACSHLPAYDRAAVFCRQSVGAIQFQLHIFFQKHRIAGAAHYDLTQTHIVRRDLQRDPCAVCDRDTVQDGRLCLRLDPQILYGFLSALQLDRFHCLRNMQRRAFQFICDRREIHLDVLCARIEGCLYNVQICSGHFDGIHTAEGPLADRRYCF